MTVYIMGKIYDGESRMCDKDQNYSFQWDGPTQVVKGQIRVPIANTTRAERFAKRYAQWQADRDAGERAMQSGAPRGEPIMLGENRQNTARVNMAGALVLDTAQGPLILDKDDARKLHGFIQRMFIDKVSEHGA